MNYYTYGQMPPELWPVRNAAPLTQVQREHDAQLPGADEQAMALGGMADAAGPEGGALDTATAAPRMQGQIAGPGTGRSDEIDAKLSDGEYVFDAETVALLGDGSTEAGARLLDEMREAIRAHKGQKLAKGEYSAPAKSPLEYLAGAQE